VSWWPLAVVLIPGILFTLDYIDRTFVNVTYLDAFIQVPYVGSVLNGGSFWSNLISSPWAGEHLLFGYRLWSIVNGSLFGLNMELDPVMFMTAAIFAAVIIFSEHKKLLIGQHPWIVLVTFLPIGFLLFSLVSPVGLNMTTEFVWGTSFSIFVAFALQRGIDKTRQGRSIPKWTIGVALIGIPLYFLALSGAYFLGLILGLIAIYLLRAIIERSWFDRGTLLFLAMSIISGAIYTYFMVHTQGKGGEASSGISTFFTDPYHTILAYLAGLSGSILDSHTLESISPTSVAEIGLGMAIVVAISLWLFIKTRMYRLSYLPVFCIFYTLGATTSVYLGRQGLTGWGGITAEWYAFHLRPAVIGVVWILMYAVVHEVRRSKAKETSAFQRSRAPIVLISLALLFIGSCQAVANSHQWKRAPYVKLYLGNIQGALLYPAFYYETAPQVLLWPASAVTADRAILIKYHLTAFGNRQLNNVDFAKEGSLIRSGSWYQNNWLGRRGTATLLSPVNVMIPITATVPSSLTRNTVRIAVNNVVVFDGSINRGATQKIILPLSTKNNVITVKCANAVEQGHGPIAKKVAVHLTFPPGL
jgi:hypothetical protein